MNLCHFVKFMIFDICFNEKKRVRLAMLLVLDNPIFLVLDNSSMLGTLGMVLLAELLAYPSSLFFL